MSRLAILFTALVASFVAVNAIEEMQALESLEESQAINARLEVQQEFEAAKIGQKADQSLFSEWTLAHDKKIALEAFGVFLFGLLIAALAWMFKNTPGSVYVPREKVEDVEAPEAEPLLKEYVPEPEKPAAPPTVTVEAQIVQEAAPVAVAQTVAVEGRDYETMVKDMLDKASDTLSSKFSAGSEVQQILEKKANTFADKAKALVLTEINETCGSIAKIMDMEEYMSMLEWDAEIASTVPPASVLLAGLLAPTNLALAFSCHLIQIVLVLLPVALALGWGTISDWNRPCVSIPTLKPWAYTSLALALAILGARIVIMCRVWKAQKDLFAKTIEMKTKLAASENAGSLSIGNLKELFLSHSTTLQYAVVCEARTRTSTCAHIVGAGSLLWLLLTGFNMFLYFYYLFTPGVVAFHESAKGQDDYCGAWATACAAKIGLLVATCFAMVNVMTVISWAFDTTLNTESITKMIAAKAKAFDRANMGIPVAQLLVKAFLIRGSSEVLMARLSVTMRERNVIAKEFADAQDRLHKLKARFEEQESLVEVLEEQMEKNNGGTMEAQAEALKEGIDIAEIKKQGASLIEEAKSKVSDAEDAATDEIEALVKKFEEMVKVVTDSEEFKAAKASAEQAAKEAADQAEKLAVEAEKAARQAKEQGAILAAQAQEKAQEQAKIMAAEAERMAAQAQEQAKILAAEAEKKTKELAAQAEIAAAQARMVDISAAQEEAKKLQEAASEKARQAAAEAEKQAANMTAKGKKGGRK
eukprot:TRINITY_DN658_c0_g5_i1.p1 TRINITY_DN658_c0_g5~~TRINITY_DN658_c0_g5_i1.p1  ORF type:complete len:758 (-),score=271.22 TRINITY_DN658_c0_g5_i1:272-2545(-)